MKKTLCGLAIILFLQILSCGGGSTGSGGSEPLPQNDGTTSETVNDPAVSTTEPAVTVPTVDVNTYTSDTSASETTTDSSSSSGSSETTPTTAADNKTNNASQDTTVSGNNDSGIGPDDKTTGNAETVSDNMNVPSSENKDNGSKDSVPNSENVIIADEDVSADAEEEIANEVPSTEVNAFDFATNVELPARIEFKDKTTGKAISGIEITVYNPENGTILARAFTNSKGISEFIITGQDAGSRIELVFKKDGYTPLAGYYIDKNDIASITELVRSIELSPIAANSGKGKDGAAVIADQDGDGIADQNDEFPADKSIAKVEKHSYIIAFEDRYPGIGDADFNDAVIRYDIDEFISSANTVPKIVIRSQVLAAGTNKNAVFAVNVAGKSYTLIENLKAEIANGWNTRASDKYLPGKVNETTIEFNMPVERKKVGAVPYDPYLIANGAQHGRSGKIKSSNEIHLSFVKTLYRKTRFAKNGLTFALLLPVDWVWPAEKVGGIFRAYPDFANWFKSGGRTNSDWYRSYDSDRIFAQAASTSSIAGYLMENKMMSTSVLIMLILMFGGAIGLIRYYRLRKN